MRPFPRLTSRKKSLTILDLMVVVAASALPMAAVAVSGPIGAAAVPLAVFMMVMGYALWWLPALGAPERRRWLDAIALPIYMTLSLLYIFVAFLTWHFAPYAVLLVFAAQVVVFVYLALRP
jgi:predicted membrane channel-forming protein YqfA (hemolysin III family)